MATQQRDLKSYPSRMLNVDGFTWAGVLIKRSTRIARSASGFSAAQGFLLKVWIACQAIGIELYVCYDCFMLRKLSQSCTIRSYPIKDVVHGS